ncbi:transmembrane protein, putative (macronuclear) [Tetrahymena thermophila SB210]|uniref:Transmembrane protein, putative n=1 Tax=Tetrahymena thermophila (strain SB210) TaxID=312017 RepID=W7XK17_TETTS|nr:transmembrane protein, putative [Tetrahymena thermophila SB210]EWS76136.1 transmembrane protein, putative [Tetrahymena thermophila SB210]|eukprot:XP_012651328.1 transmembrane protein, putative [Tetrahymena thermophila SB210]
MGKFYQNLIQNYIFIFLIFLHYFSKINQLILTLKFSYQNPNKTPKFQNFNKKINPLRPSELKINPSIQQRFFMNKNNNNIEKQYQQINKQQLRKMRQRKLICFINGFTQNNILKQKSKYLCFKLRLAYDFKQIYPVNLLYYFKYKINMCILLLIKILKNLSIIQAKKSRNFKILNMQNKYHINVFNFFIINLKKQTQKIFNLYLRKIRISFYLKFINALNLLKNKIKQLMKNTFKHFS